METHPLQRTHLHILMHNYCFFAEFNTLGEKIKHSDINIKIQNYVYLKSVILVRQLTVNYCKKIIIIVVINFLVFLKNV